MENEIKKTGTRAFGTIGVIAFALFFGGAAVRVGGWILSQPAVIDILRPIVPEDPEGLGGAMIFLSLLACFFGGGASIGGFLGYKFLKRNFE